MSATFKVLDLSVTDGVAVVTMNNPPVNALGQDFLEDLETVVQQVSERGDIRALLLASACPGYFSAGDDVRSLQNLDADTVALLPRAHALLDALEALPVPTLAAINGHALGGGLELALACDLRLMGAGEATIGLPEVKLGMIPALGGTQRLPEVVGRARATEMMITGEQLTPEQAREAGLVNEVVEEEALMDRTLARARELAQGATGAIGWIKRCVNEGQRRGFASGIAAEQQAFRANIETADAKEGIAAFLMQRKPMFKGAGSRPAPVEARPPAQVLAATKSEQLGKNEGSGGDGSAASSKPFRRARLTAIGWDRDLEIETVDAPPDQPKGDQILMQVEACGVCFRDCVDREGGFKFMQIPITPGHEVVGRVIAVGPDVSDWNVGDRVATMHRDHCGECEACELGQTSGCRSSFNVPGLIIDGGYATHMSVPQRGVFRVPDAIPAAEAAVMHCTYGTCLSNMTIAGVSEGQHVVVSGANGGVGVAAVQLASRLGATVTAVVRDEKHSDALKAMGASEVIVDPDNRFHKKLGAGLAHVVVDCVGKPTFNASLRSLWPGGKLVVIGNIVNENTEVNLGYLITRGIQIIGSSGATQTVMAKLFDLHLAQPFAVEIASQMALEQADEAQRLVRKGGNRGRVVIVP